MYINKDSIIIDGINMGKYLQMVTYEYPKFWAEGTGRNTALSGKFVGRLIGIFPKITLNFNGLSKNDIQKLAPIFDKAEQSVTYDDPSKGRITITTYSGDWKVGYKHIVNKSEPFSISFIAQERRN